MAEVYVFGSVAVDLILHVPALPQPGGHIGGTLHGWRTGGSAANLACGLASAGHHVHLVGPLGDDPIADSVVAESTLSYLGFGINPPNASSKAEAPRYTKAPRRLVAAAFSNEAS